MNEPSFSREIGRAFTRPFTRIGLSRMLFTVIGLLIPFIGMIFFIPRREKLLAKFKKEKTSAPDAPEE